MEWGRRPAARRLVRHRAHAARDARVRVDDHRRRARPADHLPAGARRRTRGADRRADQGRAGVDGVSLPRLRRARTAHDRGDRGRRARSSPPGDGTASSGGATSTASTRRRSRRAQIADGVVFGARAAHDRRRRAATTSFIWLFGAVPRSATAGSRSDRGVLGGLAFGIAAHGIRRRRSKRTRASSPWCSGSSSCRCSCSRGTFYPARRRCRSGCSGSAGSRRCGTPPSSAAMVTYGRRAALADRRARRLSGRRSPSSATCSSRRDLHEEAREMTAATQRRRMPASARGGVRAL